MTKTKLFIHATWPTLHNKPLLTNDIKPLVYRHIIENARARSIRVSAINGTADHIHLILRLHPVQNLAQVIHEIKGESSSWINSKKLTAEPFFWREKYTAITFSPSKNRMMRKILSGQDHYHNFTTYPEEVRKIVKDENYECLEESSGF